MSNGLIKFGDVFEYKGKTYIFLCKTTESIYTAEILPNNETTRGLRAKYDRIKGDPHSQHLLDQVSYCFIILEDQEYKDLIAFLGKTDHNIPTLGSMIYSLCKEDLIKLYSEVTTNDNVSIVVANTVKQLVNDPSKE